MTHEEIRRNLFESTNAGSWNTSITLPDMLDKLKRMLEPLSTPNHQITEILYEYSMDYNQHKFLVIYTDIPHGVQYSDDSIIELIMAAQAIRKSRESSGHMLMQSISTALQHGVEVQFINRMHDANEPCVVLSSDHQHGKWRACDLNGSEARLSLDIDELAEKEVEWRVEQNKLWEEHWRKERKTNERNVD